MNTFDINIYRNFNIKNYNLIINFYFLTVEYDSKTNRIKIIIILFHI